MGGNGNGNGIGITIPAAAEHLIGGRGTIVEVHWEKDAKRVQDAGACAIALGGKDFCMSYALTNLAKIKKKKKVSIPIMVSCRIGHSGEAHILEAVDGVEYIQETSSPVGHHLDKHSFKTPFVCACTNLKEALRRVSEGAALLRIQGGASAVKNIKKEISNLKSMDKTQLTAFAGQIRVPYHLVAHTRKLRRLPVPLFASARGITSPADAVMTMQLGVDGVFVGTTDWCWNPRFLSKIVEAVKHYDNPEVLKQLW